MTTLDRQLALRFVSTEIVAFHKSRSEVLRKISLDKVLLKKNPYLFRAKNLTLASDLIAAIMQAFLSSSEEEQFGEFLEELAIFVSEQTCGGKKSSAQGIDLEFDRDGTRYLLAIKSGPNWGNSSQYRRLEQDFQNALKLQRQSGRAPELQAVLGICYGKRKPTAKGVYRIYAGQSFWHFLSGDENLYVDIVEPIGHEAKRHNDDFEEQRAAVQNHLTMEFLQRFCKPDGRIEWARFVAFNSGNLPAAGAKE